MHYRRVRPCSDLINAMSVKISCLEFFVQAVCDSCSRSADLPAVSLNRTRNVVYITPTNVTAEHRE